MLEVAAKKSVHKQVLTVVTGKHNDTWRVCTIYKEQISKFMNDALGFA